MVIGTHKAIAKIVYKHILSRLNFKLDWEIFVYGNIQPDFNRSYVDCDHTMEDSLHTINSNAEELINSNISIKEFSLALGIICHFVCDYFCLHHTVDYWKRDPLAHGVYETKLHAAFLKRNFNLQYRCKPEKSVELMILKLRRKYQFEPQGINTDINYSIIAAVSICEMIVRSWLINKGLLILLPLKP
jgi:hypothetical protein